MNAAQQLLAQWMHVPAAPSLPRTTTVFNRVVPVPNGAVLPQPAGYPYVANDKLGDPRMIWRGSPIPRRIRAGRRDRRQSVQAGPQSYADAVCLYGSQRKAAGALGISLGKLQRGLRK